MELPRALLRQWTSEPAWLEALPRLASECARLWELDLETPVETPHSLVVPAGEVVLKLNAPSHVEAEHEADALERWKGRGAVRLIARDDERRALLCERCRPGSRLSEADDDDVDVVCHLVPRLSHALRGRHPFPSLASEADRWTTDVPQRYARADRPFERGLLDLALDIYRTVDRHATWLVNQDLHAANVLRARREPWLLIDPKPLAGEREIDGVGLLRNAASARSVRRWLDALAELGLDRERLRGWGIAHALAWGWSDRRGWSRWSIDVARRIRAA